MRLASSGDTALLVWNEFESMRTVQLDPDGRAKSWFSPVSDRSGRITRFTGANVGSGYLGFLLALDGAGASVASCSVG